MIDSARFFDRALRRLSRRDLLNVAWKLGAAAIAQSARPLEVRAQRATFSGYPFTLGVASGDRVSVPGAPARTGGSLVVQAGRPGSVLT